MNDFQENSRIFAIHSHITHKEMAKVMIVDDEPSILMSLDFLMKKNGFEVFIARNGAEALEIGNKEKPDVIILDVMMPEVDGYEVCEKIKANVETKHAKVIFLSAKGKDTDINKGLSLGAEMYMTKPFSTRVLLENVKQLIQKEI